MLKVDVLDARSVHLAVPEPRDDPKGQRLKTILEFIDTEHIYYLDLLEVKEIFYDELERRNVGATVLYEIFGRWPSLVLLSQAFYKELNERRPQIVSGESEMIGDIMFSHLPRCFVYRDFCAAQDARLLRLTDLCEEKPELAQLIKACERRTRAGVLPLASYFIKPVQRISKYKLLIEKILKYTAKDHPDLKNLKQSFQLASVVLDACNEAVRNRENVEQLLLLQERVIFTSAVPEITFFDQIAYLGSRSLILSGKLFKVKSGKELVVFLFNDMLFLTVPQSSSSKDTIALPLRPSPKIKTKLKVYREPFYYTDMVISDFIDNRRSRKSFAATLRRPSGNYAASVSNLANLDLENSSNSPRSSAQRARSTSVTSLAEPLPLNDLTFLVARSNDPSTSVHLRAASNSETENWISTLRQAQAQYHCAVEEYKVKSLDEMTKSSSFVAALSVTVISASDLMPSGGENKGIPSPFCVVSVCLRSRKTNVVLLRRSPTWNIGWKFPVGDVNRDVVTLTVYGRRDHQADEFLGRAEVPVSSIAQHTSAWQTTLPLSGVASGRITASFLLEFPTGGVVDDVLLITPNGQ
ncbi:hypothetical protein AAHC03_013105 [Spirometra sp. Aus1]|nr:unnamed protein product [Spirometra erinaceieuropaei]